MGDLSKSEFANITYQDWRLTLKESDFFFFFKSNIADSSHILQAIDHESLFSIIAIRVRSNYINQTDPMFLHSRRMVTNKTKR